MAFTRISFFGLPLDVRGNTADLLATMDRTDTSFLVTMVQPDAWKIAADDPTYRPLLDQMSLVLPDGLGVAAACHLITGEKCHSYSFDMTGLAKSFFEKAAQQKTPLVLVGGQPGDDEDARVKLAQHFPNVNIIETMHGYGDFESKIAMVLAKAPHIVLVSMDSPRQEAFMVAMRKAGFKGSAIGCGTFFVDYISAVDYCDYPEWAARYHLAPLYKLLKKPNRLWKRYYKSYRCFYLLLLAELAKKLKKAVEAIIVWFRQVRGNIKT